MEGIDFVGNGQSPNLQSQTTQSFSQLNLHILQHAGIFEMLRYKPGKISFKNTWNCF